MDVLLTPHASIADLAKLRIKMDEANGLIIVDGFGVWDMLELDQHFAELGRLAARFRARYGHARVMVDLRRAPAQPTSAIDRIRSWNQSIYRPGDRCGIIVASSLLKLQMRRLFQDDVHAIFLSENAAKTWVMAYANPPLAMPA